MKRKRFLGAARFGAFLLAAGMLLSLAACGKSAAGSTASNAGAQNTGAAMGRWVEESLDLGAQGKVFTPAAPVAMEDGSLCLYGTENFSTSDRDNSGLCRFTSVDGGKSWKKETLDWAQQAGGQIMSVAALPDGTCFLASYQTDADGQTVQYTGWLKKAGADTLTQYTLPDGIALQGATYSLMDDHTLAAVVSMADASTGTDSTSDTVEMDDPQKTILLNLDTNEVTDLSDTAAQGELYYSALDSSGETPRLYFTHYSENGPTLMALDTTGKIETLLDTLPDKVSSCTTDADGNYYCAAMGGIYRLAKDGSLMEQVMPSTGFQLGLSSNFCYWLARTQEGDFLAAMMDDASDGMSLYRYHWDETLPAQSEDALTVWSLSDNATVRAAITAYQKANPDTTINYQPVLAAEDSVDGTNATDAIQALNTQLLAGQGPDILVLDDTDYEAYARQGLLADLSSSVDTAALAQNIVSPFLSQEGTYVLPARFTVPVITGETGTLASLTSLDALQQAILACPPRPNQDMNDESYYAALEDDARYGMGFLSARQLMTFVLQSSEPALVQDGQVNEEAVRQALSFVQAVGEYYDMKHYDADPTYNGVGISGDNGDTVVQGDGGYEFDVTNQARYGWDMLLSCAYFGTIQGNAAQGCEAAVRPGLVEGAYLPSTLMAVNANSVHREAALALLQTVFGEEVQGTFQTDGSPVLQSALDASIQNNEAANVQAGYTGDTKAFFASLKTPVIIDSTVKAAMVTHAEALVSGSESLDDAVTGVSHDLSLYLAEKQ